jgi:hypothetical protein
MTTTTNPTILASGEYASSPPPLPSWNEGSTKKSILDFVGGVTTAGGRHFVKPEDRIAVFDNDGTLWSEQPFYFQFAFVLDRMKAMAAQHPEWKDNPLYAAVLANDMKTIAAGGIKGVLELATVTHAGMTTDEFAKIVEDWHGRLSERTARCTVSHVHVFGRGNVRLPIRQLRNGGETTPLLQAGTVSLTVRRNTIPSSYSHKPHL